MVPAFALSESKLRRPAGRPGIVARPALIDRLSSVETPVISIVAPAGYGKTTLLAQWGEVWQPRVAWVSADHRDNDPAVLLTYLATAVDRIEPLTPAVLRTLAHPATPSPSSPLLASAIGSMRRADCAGPRRCGGDHEPGVHRHDHRARVVVSGRIPVCHRIPGYVVVACGPAPRARRHHRDRRRRPRHVRAGGGRATRRRRRRRRRVRRRRPRPTHRGLARRPLPRRAGDAGR